MLTTVDRKGAAFRVLMVMALLSFGLIVLIVETRASNLQEEADLTEGLYQVDGTGFPAVVAYANDHSISGLALARRIYVLNNSPAIPGKPENTRLAALNLLIGETILKDVAEDVGVTVSVAEAREFALKQEQRFLLSSDPGGLAMYSAAARQFGVSPDEFASQPEAINAYRDSLVIGKMHSYIRDTLPADQRYSGDAFQRALETFVSQHTKDVRILIEP